VDIFYIQNKNFKLQTCMQELFNKLDSLIFKEAFLSIVANLHLINLDIGDFMTKIILKDFMNFLA
jgi:hypothetical protein